MPVNNFFQNRFIDRTTKILSRVLDYRSANQRIISANLANADTPGFKPKELRFDEELQRVAEKNNIRIQTTDRGHLSQSSNFSGGDFPIVTQVTKGPGSERDELNIDAEMAKMMQNNLLSSWVFLLRFPNLKFMVNVVLPCGPTSGTVTVNHQAIKSKSWILIYAMKKAMFVSA